MRVVTTTAIVFAAGILMAPLTPSSAQSPNAADIAPSARGLQCSNFESDELAAMPSHQLRQLYCSYRRGGANNETALQGQTASADPSVTARLQYAAGKCQQNARDLLDLMHAKGVAPDCESLAWYQK